MVMDEKPILPIDKIVDLYKFELEIKNKYLDKRVLDSTALRKINALFGIGNDSTGRINCCEFHGHSYECIQFYHPATAIVDRLLNEITMYKGRLSKIEKIIKDNDE